MNNENDSIKKPISTFNLERLNVIELDFSNLPLIIKGDKNE